MYLCLGMIIGALTFLLANEFRQDGSLDGKIPIKYNTHPTVKPLKLLEYLCILTKTPTGGIILDPFAGSGTTCMAAKKIGRTYIGIEQDEEYCKIARARIDAIEPEKNLF